MLNPTVSLLLMKDIRKALEEVKNAPITMLKELEARSQIEANILLSQAKVEQELAIAERIKNSDEVEIEEFYDTSGKGHAGLNTEQEKILLGISAEGRKVTKRIIKFKGNTIVQNINSKDFLETENL